jgi:aconitase B
MIQMDIWQPCAGLIMGIANKDRADIYKYLNFNQIESFKDMADTVKA